MESKKRIGDKPEDALLTNVITIEVSTRSRSVEDVLTLCKVQPNLHAEHNLVNDQTVILIYLLPRPIYIWDYPKVQKFIVAHYFENPKVPLHRQIKVPLSLRYASITLLHKGIVVPEEVIAAAIRS